MKILILLLLIPLTGFAKNLGPICGNIFEFNKSNHESTIFVDSKGQAFPSVAYRYYSYKELKALLKLLESKHLIIDEKNWIYITFEKYETAYDAKNSLQVPHDASIRVTFSLSVDTAVIKVPKGKYGKGPWLEPFAKDHPEFGKGGGSQYIISHSKLTILEIYDLKTNKAL